MAPRGDGGPGDAWGHSQTPAPTAVPRLRARPGAHRGKKPPRRAQRAPRAPRLCQRKEKKTNKGERSHLLSSLSSVPAKTALGSCRLRQHAQKPCSTPGLELWKISGITKAFLKAPGARRLLQGHTSPGHAVPVPTSPWLCRSCFEEQASCSALGVPKTEGHRDLVPLSPPKPTMKPQLRVTPANTAGTALVALLATCPQLCPPLTLGRDPETQQTASTVRRYTIYSPSPARHG